MIKYFQRFVCDMCGKELDIEGYAEPRGWWSLQTLGSGDKNLLSSIPSNPPPENDFVQKQVCSIKCIEDLCRNLILDLKL